MHCMLKASGLRCGGQERLQNRRRLSLTRRRIAVKKTARPGLPECGKFFCLVKEEKPAEPAEKAKETTEEAEGKKEEDKAEKVEEKKSD